MIGETAFNPVPAPPGPNASGVPTPQPVAPVPAAKEIGGRAGLDPTRYGDWEKNGRCIDF
ncbi:MAG: DUF1674 domain-containing protein [Gammaproteobacteria bacterium]|nr:DUF1674 domain-containing protein [Gammaproteobacteria bacterium]